MLSECLLVRMLALRMNVVGFQNAESYVANVRGLSEVRNIDSNSGWRSGAFATIIFCSPFGPITIPTEETTVTVTVSSPSLPLFTAAEAKLLVNNMNTARIKSRAQDRIARYFTLTLVTAIMLHCKLTILELTKLMRSHALTLMHMHPIVRLAGRRRPAKIRIHHAISHLRVVAGNGYALLITRRE